MKYDAIAQLLSVHGMAVRGGFHPVEEDLVPLLNKNVAVQTLVLVGNVGSAMWERFQTSRLADTYPDPMNTWTKKVLEITAKSVDADVVFPFGGPPYYPFQRWARRAEAVYSSPLGILIHPRYGLWHAYRGALLFGEKFAVPSVSDLASPCDSCRDKPCLSTCPVGAFSGNEYDVSGCANFLGTHDGTDCLKSGCAARRACPVGEDFIYESAHASFHMRAFADVMWERRDKNN